MGFGDFASSTSKTKTTSPVFNVGAEGGSVAAVIYGKGAVGVLPGGAYYRTGKGGSINLTVTGAPPSTNGTYLANAIEAQGTPSAVTGLPAIAGDGKKTLIVGAAVAFFLFIVLFFVRK